MWLTSSANSSCLVFEYYVVWAWRMLASHHTPGACRRTVLLCILHLHHIGPYKDAIPATQASSTSLERATPASPERPNTALHTTSKPHLHVTTNSLPLLIYHYAQHHHLETWSIQHGHASFTWQTTTDQQALQCRQEASNFLNLTIFAFLCSKIT